MEESENKSLEYYKDKVILVTGGCGSIGSEIVKKLLRFEPKLLKVLDISESGLFYLEQQLREHSNIRYLVGDIRDKHRLKFAMRNVDVVFHAAALKHVPLCEYNPYEAVKTNVIGTQNIVDIAREEEVDRVIGISTDKAVNPINTMGATKLLSEKLMLGGRVGTIKTKFSCVRFGNVLNSSGSVIPIFKSQIKKGGPLTITSKDMTRFFMSISQAVDLVLDAGVRTNGEEIFILKMPALKITDLAEVLIEDSKKKHPEDGKNIDIKFIGKRPGEKLHEILVSEEESEHLTDLGKMFVLREGFTTPHHVEKGVPSAAPVNLEGYHSGKIRHLTKDEIRKVLIDEDIL